MKKMSRAEMLEYGRKFYGKALDSWTDREVIAFVKSVFDTKRVIDREIERRVKAG
jgi:hypothetical protein